MQISSNPAAMAAQQIAKSAEMMNQLNQNITDQSQHLSNKMVRVAVEGKITNQEQQSKIDLLA